IWNYDPQKIGLEFVSRIPKPPMEDVIKSAIGIPTEGYLHQLHFYYPIEGGYESVVHAFAKRVKGEITTSWPVTEIEWLDEHWHVRTKSGEERLYHELVSTIPVHELLEVWPAAPQQARDAAARLRYNSLINVLLGLDEDRGYPYTALYVPDPEIPFHRVSFPKNFSEHMVPPGKSSIMAEITAHEGDGLWTLSDDEIVSRVCASLRTMGFLDPGSVAYKRVVRITYGYPVYDLEYRKNVTELREAIARAGVRLLGRFAQFEYINSDVCVERAIALANEL
ncbi:MAG TPA: FAD-dependent oxidoreductase, partial [Thermoanaerobaculia bacterium]